MIEKEFGHYRVVINQDNESNIFIITFDHWNKIRNQKERSAFLEIEKNCYITKKGLNRIYIQTSENDWYQRDGVKEAINYIKNFKKENIYISYGGSMAGYAAIEFSRELNADFFLSLSPQFSFEEKYLSSINDNRWMKDRLYLQDNGYTIKSNNNTGINLNSKGIVFYDPLFVLDRKHAESIKTNTQAFLIKSYGTHHHAGVAVNHLLNIVNLLKEIGETIRKKENISPLLEKITNTIEKSDFKKLVIEKDVDYLAFANVDIIRKIDINSWVEIHRSGDENYISHVIKYLEDNQKEELRYRIINDISNLTLSEISKNHLKIGADLLRDEALKHEKNDIFISFFLMSLAQKARPNGGFINQKIKDYRNILSLSEHK